MEQDIIIRNGRRKCSVCGKCGDGLLLKSVRYERLLPVFLCGACLTLLNDHTGREIGGR